MEGRFLIPANRHGRKIVNILVRLPILAGSSRSASLVKHAAWDGRFFVPAIDGDRKKQQIPRAVVPVPPAVRARRVAIHADRTTSRDRRNHRHCVPGVHDRTRKREAASASCRSAMVFVSAARPWCRAVLPSRRRDAPAPRPSRGCAAARSAARRTPRG